MFQQKKKEPAVVFPRAEQRQKIDQHIGTERILAQFHVPDRPVHARILRKHPAQHGKHRLFRRAPVDLLQPALVIAGIPFQNFSDTVVISASLFG